MPAFENLRDDLGYDNRRRRTVQRAFICLALLTIVVNVAREYSFHKEREEMQRKIEFLVGQRQQIINTMQEMGFTCVITTADQSVTCQGAASKDELWNLHTAPQKPRHAI